MKIILVQPRIGYMDALRSAPFLPLGLLSAASKLVQDFEVELIDARLTKNIEKRLIESLSNDTLFVGVTCHTGPMIRGALQVSRLVKQVSNVPVVWGGIHASLAPEETAADPAVDICVVGEGEQTTLELAEALKSGKELDSVKGIAFYRDGKVVRTATRDLLSPDRWSEPAYKLVDIQSYLPLYAGRRSLSFQASRGCLHRCGYCYNAPFNRRTYRKLDPEIALARLQKLKEMVDFSDVYFVDDNFLVDRDWSEKIAAGCSDLGLTWQIQGIDIGNLLRMPDVFFKRMRELGCRRLSVGVETGSNRIRRSIHKFGTRDDVVRAIGRLNGSGLDVYASFLTGLPGETIDDIRQTVELAFELVDRFDFVHCSPFYCYSPFPGTETYQAAIREGFVPPAKLEGWADTGSWDHFSWERKTPDRVLDRQFFEGLNTATLFIDRKIKKYSTSKMLSILFGLYRPIARFRTRHLFLDYMPERWLLRKFYDYLSRAK
jgi:radical SAM superfamily enzyme YgiQ (UPF0313 family)